MSSRTHSHSQAHRSSDRESKFQPKGKNKEEQETWGDPDQDAAGKPKIEKEQPNFGLSGKLTEETNTFRGVVIKYSEPPEARKPQKIRWRLYPFKGQEALPVMYIHRQSAYLLGRERKIADIPIDHPSCSKQHAVIQFRLMPYERADGTSGRRIKPYIIDLESANGTLVNGNKIEPKRYVELFEKDVLKFGFSSREYVLLNEQSKDDLDSEDEVHSDNTPEQRDQSSKQNPSSSDLLPIKNEPANLNPNESEPEPKSEKRKKGKAHKNSSDEEEEHSSRKKSKKSKSKKHRRGSRSRSRSKSPTTSSSKKKDKRHRDRSP